MGADVEAERSERPRQAVAVVGVGCRLPGGISDLDGLWEALARGDDLVGTIPPDRFEVDRFVDESTPRPDRGYTRAGGFLDGDVAAFDAAYFGISPKEAAAMDPQQRLLLELAAEAFDDAGIDPATLAGSGTGVFIGISDVSYGMLQSLEHGGIGPYSMSGGTLSIAANRLSHVFDLRGPSMSIDTACSSSLQAVERACRALGDGSCEMALAGGVNLLIGPIAFVGFSQSSMLSPTGRCRAFSADADGFVRAEGGGVVVLKPLARALADGDRVYGVIVGAAAGNDGHTMGLALPNPQAQRDLLLRVYGEAGISPDDVVYVEAHGTGTQAGDPAECDALGQALGRLRTTGPLPIGSVKTNLGHLEPASGMPGLFKALLVLRHRTIPPSLHAGTLNPRIDFDALNLNVVTRPRPLPDDVARPIVGVNSFGFGGANVHVAVTAPPPPSAAAPATDRRGSELAADRPTIPLRRPTMPSGRHPTAFPDRPAPAAAASTPDDRRFAAASGGNTHEAVPSAPATTTPTANGRAASRHSAHATAHGPATDRPTTSGEAATSTESGRTPTNGTGTRPAPSEQATVRQPAETTTADTDTPVAASNGTGTRLAPSAQTPTQQPTETTTTTHPDADTHTPQATANRTGTRPTPSRQTTVRQPAETTTADTDTPVAASNGTGTRPSPSEQATIRQPTETTTTTHADAPQAAANGTVIRLAFSEQATIRQPAETTSTHATADTDAPLSAAVDGAAGDVMAGPGHALPFVVSARSPAALDEAIGRAAAHLATVDEGDFYDVAYTSARRRAVHRHRAVVLAGSAAAAGEALHRLAAAKSSDMTEGDGVEARGDAEAVRGEAVERGRVAFVFCGNGSQWAGMGADLLADPAFRRAVEAVDAELSPRLGWSVSAELALPPDRWRLAATEVAQPLLFAVQAGLVEMLREAGVRPGAVVGHSVGEVAAAYAAGVLTLPQAARVIAERGLAQSVTRGLGRMAAAGLPEAAARQVLQDHPLVEVAAVNSDRDVTLAGPGDALRRLGEELAAREVFFRELDVDHPFHSSAMDPVRGPLSEALADLRPSRSRIPMISTVTGEALPGEEADAGYWWRNVRRPVRFAASAERLVADGFDVLVEVGPHPVLGSYLRRVSAAARVRAAVVPTVRRAAPGPAAVRSAVARVVAAGGELDWDRHFPRPGRVRPLPAYPWQRQRHWIGGPETWARTLGDPRIVHPLLGQRLPTLDPAWYGELDRVRAPWISDHRAGGSAVLPATGYVEMALAAGRLAIPEAAEAVEVDQVAITRALVVPEPNAEPVCVQTSLSAATGVITVAGTTVRGEHAREHFRARVRPLLRQPPPPLDVAALRARVAAPVDVADYYARAAEGAMVWRAAFQVLTGLWQGDGEVLGAYCCPDQRDDRYQAHPVVLDSALQAGVLWLVEELRSGVGYMPATIGAVRLWGRTAPEGLVYVRQRSRTDDEVCWDITVADPDGRVSAELESCRLRRLPARHATPVTRFHVELRAAPRPGEPAEPWPASPPAAIVAGARERLSLLRTTWRELDHAAYADRLEETFARALASALVEATGGPGRALAADDLADACRRPHHRRMVRAALPLLERFGLLERLPGGNVRLTPVAGPDQADALRDLLLHGAAFPAQSALTARACLHLPALLRGDRTASDVITGGGAGELLDQHHDVGPANLLGHRMARALVERIVAEWPADRPLRVLEIDAGTGGATASLLPALPADRTRYVVTDAAESALTRLRKRFAAYDFVDYRLLNLDTDLDTAPGTGDARPGTISDTGHSTSRAPGYPLADARHGTTADTGSETDLHVTHSTHGGTAHDAASDDDHRVSHPVGGDVAPPGTDHGTAYGPGSDADVLSAPGASPDANEHAKPGLGPGTDLVEVGGHDLIVAAGCLHLSRDLAATLRRLAALLAPGGKLLVVEPHRTGVLLPFLGLTEEFWNCADTGLRPDSPLLPAGRWPDLLAETGYTDVVQLTPQDDPGPADFSVMLATAPVHPARPESEPSPGSRTVPESRTGEVWVVAGESEGGAGPLADALVSTLEEAGGRTSVVPFGADSGGWADGVPAGAEAVTFVLVLDGDGGAGPDDVVERVTRRVAALRAVALACEQVPQGLPVSLWLVTRPCGALPEPGGGPVFPEDAAAWGAARTLGNEDPRLDVRRVCLHRSGDDARDAARLAAELLEPGDEDEILLTRRGRFVPRLVETGEATRVVPAGGAYRLKVCDPGLAHTLAWERAEMPEPGPGQVLVAVRAIGLNYRDVMRAVNMLPAEAVEAVFGGHELGLECAGTVVAVGPGVTRVRPGDRVGAAGPVGFGSHALVEEWMTGPIPDGMTFTAAAATPMAYATAAYSLNHCARLRAGETVLVHGGAGGVGMAAVEYARHVGARVIATAGSPAKRDLLRALGADHVLDSRSLRFGERIRELTEGRGVDVVLNSLAGEALVRGLEALGHGGRFVELGKRDIFEGGQLPLRPFGNNVAFFGVDVGTLMWRNPALAAAQVNAQADAASGFVRELPHTVYPADQVADAFAQMRHSRHIGKIIISLDSLDGPRRVRGRTGEEPWPGSGGTYLITGGLTGFGAATARHLARRGVRHLALVGRRGAETPGAAELLAELTALGAEPRPYAADVADPDAMRRVLADLDAAGRPVRGVVHAAMRLDDAPLADLDDERIRAVLRPKVAGAYVLDELTRDRPVEAFVLYSSLTTIGNIGQAPYVAANLCLEALARRRRAEGRPALAVALGALAGTGVLSRGTQAESLAKAGIGPVPPARALAAVDDMVAEGVVTGVVGRCDWVRMRQVLPGLRRPWLSAVLPPGAGDDDALIDPLPLLAAMSGEEAHAFVAGQIAEALAGVLAIPAGELAYDRRLDEYGMDSLMATELLLTLRGRFNVEIPPMELIRGAGTIDDISRTVLARLGVQGPAR